MLQTAAELEKRRENFTKELDFVFADVVYIYIYIYISIYIMHLYICIVIRVGYLAKMKFDESLELLAK